MPYFVQRVFAASSNNLVPDPYVDFEVTMLHLPFLMATDERLQHHVQNRLREAFVGYRFMTGEAIEAEMSRVAVEAIVEKYPVRGLREVLQAYEKLDMGDLLSEEERPNLSPPEKPKVELSVVTLEEV